MYGTEKRHMHLHSNGMETKQSYSYTGMSSAACRAARFSVSLALIASTSSCAVANSKNSGTPGTCMSCTLSGFPENQI